MALETIEDIIRALQEHPEWREPLLNALLTDQYRQMPSRIDRIEEALMRLVEQTAETDRRLRELAEQNERRFQELAEYQKASDRRINQLTARIEALVERVTEMRYDLSFLKGQVLEDYYRNHATSILGKFFKRMRFVETGIYLDSLDDQRPLSREDWDELRLVDMLSTGRHRETGEDYLMVWEISWTVDDNDVQRALARAERLRQWDIRTVAVVAGKGITGSAHELAQQRGVLVVLDGVPQDGSGLIR
jgi:hypothetical protein